MKSKLTLIDFIKEVESTHSKYEFAYVFYSGLAEQEIMINTVFEYLQETKEPKNLVRGLFEIESIILMSKNSNTIPKGYNALVFAGSTVSLQEIKKNIRFNQKGNFEHVCILTNNLEPQDGIITN